MLAHILIAALGEAAMLIARADAARAQAELLFNRMLHGFTPEGGR